MRVANGKVMMIRVLLIESDPRLRDIIEVGLDTFQAFEIDRAKDASALQMMQEKRYELVIANMVLGDDGRGGKGGGNELIRLIREKDQTIEIIALADAKSARSRGKEKATSSLFAIIPTPLDEQHFYKTLARAKDRIEAKQAALKGEEPPRGR